jgi:hypothetical protein
MPITNFLGVQLMEAGQAQPHLTHNEAIVDIDKAVAGRFAKDMTGLTSYTLTAAESTNHQVNVFGTPSAGITINVQGVAKTWVFVNDTAQEATFKTSAGTGVIVRPWSFVHLFCDGTNVHGAAAAIVEHLTVSDGKHFQFGTASGSKLGSAASEKLALWGATPIVQPANANQAAVTQTAGATYTATEQAMLNALKTLVNQLRTDLVAAGVIKGSA